MVQVWFKSSALTGLDSHKFRYFFPTSGTVQGYCNRSRLNIWMPCPWCAAAGPGPDLYTRCICNDENVTRINVLSLLLIIVAPQITTHPQNKTVTEGNNITLSCNASGDPEPVISWFRGESVLTRDDARIFLGADSKQLTITSIKRNNTGEYRCVANNSAGNATGAPNEHIAQNHLTKHCWTYFRI